MTLFANSKIIYLENPEEFTKKQLECLSELGKVVGNIVNPWNNQLYVYINEKPVNWFKITVYNTIKERIPMKYLEIYLVHDTYIEKDKILLQEIKDLNKGKVIPCSWIKSLNIFKMTILTPK